MSGHAQNTSDRACHLQVFKSSGNNLGVSGVWEIVRAIERGNWSITKVEVYGNQLDLLSLPDTGPWLSRVVDSQLIRQRSRNAGCNEGR